MALQFERLNGRAKRTHDLAIDDLPDGTVVAPAGERGAALALRGSYLLRWSEHGYVGKVARPRGGVKVLTPPSIVAVLGAGYPPLWHPTADQL